MLATLRVRLGLPGFLLVFYCLTAAPLVAVAVACLRLRDDHPWLAVHDALIALGAFAVALGVALGALKTS